jgi:hypothetical protein
MTNPVCSHHFCPVQCRNDVAIRAEGWLAVEVVVVCNFGLALLFITWVALTISTTVRSSGTLVEGMARVVDTVLGAGIAMMVLYTSEWYRLKQMHADDIV